MQMRMQMRRLNPRQMALDWLGLVSFSFFFYLLLLLLFEFPRMGSQRGGCDETREQEEVEEEEEEEQWPKEGEEPRCFVSTFLFTFLETQTREKRKEIIDYSLPLFLSPFLPSSLPPPPPPPPQKSAEGKGVAGGGWRVAASKFPTMISH